MAGRLSEFVKVWMGITQDPFMLGTIQGHQLQFNQKFHLAKPTHKFKLKVPKAQESMMTSELSSMLSNGTLELGPWNKGFFTYPFLIHRKNWESHFIMNLKLLNQFITCTKFTASFASSVKAVYQFKTLPFNLSADPKTFMRVMKLILHLC